MPGSSNPPLADRVLAAPRAAWLALALLVAVWLGLDRLVQVTRDAFVAHFQISTTRALVATRALFNVGQMWVALLATAWLLRARGQSLADIGWRRPASRRAWVLSVGLVILYLVPTLILVGRSAQLFSDWSFYRVSLGIILGVSAGICQETIFRGFVIRQTRDAGLPVAVQVLLSSVLFGLALSRIGWAGTGTAPPIGVALAAVAASTILGAAFAAIYLAGRRSLGPAIFAHAAIDVIVQPGMILFLSRP
jgi:hypothetical protein